MAGENGLGALEVGVAGNQGIGMGLGLGQEGPFEAHQGPIDQIDLAAQPEAHIRAHLIVTAAAGVELFAQGPEQGNQPMLHRKMHVLRFQTWIELASCRFSADQLQAPDQLRRLSLGDHATSAQHPGMGHGTIEILFQQLQIEADRRIEPLNRRVQPLIKTITPSGGASRDRI